MSKSGSFHYDVSLDVDLTVEEIRFIQSCCQTHYDWRVKAAGNQGGFVYGWLNWLGAVGDTELRYITCSHSELDTCMKALESPIAYADNDDDRQKAVRLFAILKEAARLIQEEYNRLTYQVSRKN